MNHKKGTTWIRRGVASLATAGAVLFLAFPAAAAGYVQTNLVSDIPGLAKFTDSNLKNPWGISHSATSPFWISDNATGLSTLYNTAGTPQALVVTIPPPPGSAVGTMSTPTGQVFNSTPDFLLSSGSPARFIFATEDGTISGWNPSANPTVAILKVDNSISAVYKGLALGNIGTANFLYAANFSQGKIDVFDSGFSPATVAGGFLDPGLPSGYAPFNIQALGTNLFVTYALQDATGHDDDPGPGHGYVDVFDFDGNLVKRLISGGALNSPWGLALTPANFGEFSNDLLVGNFGDGKINAFDPKSGDLLGTLEDKDGKVIEIDGLWGLIFGNGGDGGYANFLYFTAGLDGETHGLFGSLEVPVPPALILFGSGLIGLLTFSRVKRKGA